MKKILIVGFAVLFGLQSCKKEEQRLLEEKKPEQRVGELLLTYKNELINADNGWIATLNTKSIQGIYSFYLKFNNDDRVSMLADFDPVTAQSAQESSYSLKEVMGPTLIFDTYNFLHQLQDPDPDSFEGIAGQGYGTDFEFVFEKQVGDTLELVGKKRKSILKLVKATTAQANLYKTGDYARNIDQINTYISKNSNKFFYLQDSKVNGDKIQVIWSTAVNNRKITLCKLDNGAISVISSPFLYNLTGISPASSLSYPDLRIDAFDWNSENQKLFAHTSKGEKLELLVSDTQIQPLHLMLGIGYKHIQIPNETSYVGWSADFISRKQSVNSLLGRNITIGSAPTRLSGLEFEFDDETKQMELTVIVASASTTIASPYAYTYTRSDAGLFKFNFVDSKTADANFIYNQGSKPLAPLLDQRINTDTFTVDYYVDPVTKELLAQFKSLEHPDFVFTGKF